MSTDNTNLDNEEYLNKLIKFKNKREDLAQIHNVVNQLNEELPPNEIRKIKAKLNWNLISGVFISLIAIVTIIYVLSLPKKVEDQTQLIAELNVKDTTNFTFYILNNIGKGKYFNLNYDQANKLKEMLPDSSVYNATFISQNGKSSFTFDNKDNLIISLNNEIKVGGDMEWLSLVDFFEGMNQVCLEGINTNFIALGNTPVVFNTDVKYLKSIFDITKMSNLDSCRYIKVIYLRNDSNDFNESNDFFEKLRKKFNLKLEVVK